MLFISNGFYIARDCYQSCQRCLYVFTSGDGFAAAAIANASSGRQRVSADNAESRDDQFTVKHAMR